MDGATRTIGSAYDVAGARQSMTYPDGNSIAYTYDARGRLVKVVHTGTVNTNNQACYKYDKAGNRTTVQTTVASLPACP
jgi:YD repeat-containing protein